MFSIFSSSPFFSLIFKLRGGRIVGREKNLFYTLKPVLTGNLLLHIIEMYFVKQSSNFEFRRGLKFLKKNKKRNKKKK